MKTMARRRNLLAGLATFCLAALTLSSLVSQTHAVNGIYVSAVKPSSANPGTEVHVYGGGATPGGMVFASLETPNVYLFDKSIPVNLSPLNESTYTLWNGSYMFEPVQGQGIPFNGSIIGLSNGSLPIIINWINGSYFNVFNSSIHAYTGLIGFSAGSARADGSGDWEIEFSAPSPLGNYTLTVVDNQTLTSDSVPFEVVSLTPISTENPAMTSLISLSGLGLIVLLLGTAIILGAVVFAVLIMIHKARADQRDRVC